MPDKDRYSSKYRVTNMPVQAINARVEAIKNNHGDDESQHAAEDNLMIDFIAHIACSADKVTPELLMRKAQAVLKTRDLKFARWCA